MSPRRATRTSIWGLTAAFTSLSCTSGNSELSGAGGPLGSVFAGAGGTTAVSIGGKGSQTAGSDVMDDSDMIAGASPSDVVSGVAGMAAGTINDGSGGTSNGGTSNGGTSNGGTSNGGTSNGGTSNGGTSNGGTSNGGTSNGGTALAPSSGGQLTTAGIAGTGGNPEDGTASICVGNYLACGCGCCPDISASTTCYYPELGEDLSSIIRADELEGQQAACANTLCGQGRNYACCATPPLNPSEAASYSTSFYVGGYDHLTLNKTMGHDCATFELLRPVVGRSNFRIDVPEGWRASLGTLQTCQASGSTSLAQPFGGLGSLRLRPKDAGCVVDANFTLFFERSPGLVESVRFHATDVLVDLPASRCM